MYELFSNGDFVTSILASAITSTAATSISVSSTTGMPTGGSFRLRIDDEILQVTAVSGTTLTVVRGSDGTTAATHTISSNVYVILTKAALDNLLTLAVGGTDVTNRRRVNLIGGPYALDNGSLNSVDLYLGHDTVITPPNFGSYSWFNQGSASLTVTGVGTAFLRAPGITTNSCRILEIVAPTAPYSVVIKGIPLSYATGANGGSSGICFRNSSTGAMITYGWDTSGPRYYRWNSATSIASTIGLAMFANCPTSWLRMDNDGTNRNTYVSLDGMNWTAAIPIEGVSAFTTTDRVGIYVDSQRSSAQDAGLLVSSFKVA